MQIRCWQVIVAFVSVMLPLLKAAGAEPKSPSVVTVFEQDDDANYHIPNLVVANDGTVLAFCEERWRSPWDNVAECHIVLRRSLDHANSQLASESGDTDHEELVHVVEENG